MVPASIKGKYIIRFTVTSQYTTEEDIDRDWKIIKDMYMKMCRAESDNYEVYYFYMDLVTGKPVFGISDLLMIKPVCSATETRKSSKNIPLSYYLQSE